MFGFIGKLPIGQRLLSLAIIALSLTAIPTLLYGTAAWEQLHKTGTVLPASSQPRHCSTSFD